MKVTGRRVNSQGYVMLKIIGHHLADSQGYVREHRLVMEKKLGRRLLPGEVVHHIDGDTANNAPENLELFASNGEHLRTTRAGKCPNWSEEGRVRLRASSSRPKPEDVRRKISATLTIPIDFDEVERRLGDGERLVSIARSLGISPHTLGQRRIKAGFPPLIRRQRTKDHAP